MAIDFDSARAEWLARGVRFNCAPSDKGAWTLRVDGSGVAPLASGGLADALDALQHIFDAQDKRPLQGEIVCEAGAEKRGERMGARTRKGQRASDTWGDVTPAQRGRRIRRPLGVALAHWIRWAQGDGSTGSPRPLDLPSPQLSEALQLMARDFHREHQRYLGHHKDATGHDMNARQLSAVTLAGTAVDVATAAAGAMHFALWTMQDAADQVQREPPPDLGQYDLEVLIAEVNRRRAEKGKG